MRVAPLTFPGLAAALFLVAACTGTGINTVALYPVQQGATSLEALTDDPSITSVQFLVNDQNAGVDNDPSNGWSANFDTTGVPNGPARVQAIGTTQAGESVTLLDTTILINNPAGGAVPSTAPSTTPTTGGNAADEGNGTGTATDTGSGF